MLLLVCAAASLPLASEESSNPTLQQAIANALGSIAGNAQISLDMAERVEFLLVPALMAQDAMSEDIVMTYPGF